MPDPLLAHAPGPAGSGSVPESWFRDGRPHWDAISFDIHCSRCGYNLRMLVEPRCPECGLVFAWQEVFAHISTRNELLFEHTWRKRPVRTWLGAVWHTVRPRHFWKRVSIHNPVHVGPLVFLLIVSTLGPVLVGFAAIGIPVVYRLANRMSEVCWSARYMATARVCDRIATYLQSWWSSSPAPVGSMLAWLGVVCILPLLFATVASLRQTLGRCQVRTVQILRVVTYAAVPTCLIWTLMLGVHLLLACQRGYGGEPGFIDVKVTAASGRVWGIEWLVYGLVLPLLFVLTPVLYLRIGLRDYLRLPGATAIAAATFIIAMLTTVILLVLVPPFLL